jgi:sensor histidine kinase YesM
MLIETGVVFATSQAVHAISIKIHYQSILGTALIRLISLLFVIVIRRFLHNSKSNTLPFSNWIFLITIPIISLPLLFALFTDPVLNENELLVCVVIVFTINLIVIYLFDRIANIYELQERIKIEAAKKQYYESLLSTMDDNLKSLHSLKHDLRNIISPLYGLAESGKNEELKKQLEALTDRCNLVHIYSDTGNQVIDNIINYKFRDCKSTDISLELSLSIPKNLPVSSVDLSIILGNLIDNALEAVNKTNNKRISLIIKFDKGRLFISIFNTFNGIVLRKNSVIKTTKENSQNHGIGLESVQATLNKYDGLMKISHTDSIFTVKAMLYV